LNSFVPFRPFLLQCFLLASSRSVLIQFPDPGNRSPLYCRSWCLHTTLHLAIPLGL